MKVKDLINTDQSKFKNYRFLDKSSLGQWTIDYRLIDKSQFIIYRAQENEYIDLLQVGRHRSSESRNIIINNPQYSEVFSQMDKDLQIVDGSLINKEIKNLTIKGLITVDKQKSDSQKLFLEVLSEPIDIEDDEEESVNESDN